MDSTGALVPNPHLLNPRAKYGLQLDWDARSLTDLVSFRPKLVPELRFVSASHRINTAMLQTTQSAILLPMDFVK